MAKFSLGNEFSKNNIETDVPVTKKTSKYSSFLEEQISEPINQAASSDSKRINMAFTPGNIELIEKLTEKYNINKTFLINSIVRIISTVRIDSDNYTKVSEEADIRNQTITQYVNLLLEIFAGDTATE